MPLPSPLITAIEDEVKGHDAKALAGATEELSRSYRGDVPTKNPVASDLHRAAYVVTRAPATYASVQAVLEELRPRLAGAEIRSLLDLGAGPGIAAWAAAQVFPDLERINLMERDGGFIRVGERLAARSQHAALLNAEWRQADLSQLAELPAHDLVVLSYSLGELTAPEPVLQKSWAAARVALAVIEPGTPRGFKTILNARARLIKAGAHLAAPCPHEEECPMAAGGKDWCHFSARLERSQLHRYAKSAALGYEDEKFSYAAVTKAHVVPAAARVVRHPLTHKGHIELLLCTHAGLRKQVVGRSDKERFRQARKASWGSNWEWRP